MLDVVEVFGHIFFVLFKCNRVSNQIFLGFAGLLAVGQLAITHNTSLIALQISPSQYWGFSPATVLALSLALKYPLEALVRLDSPSSSLWVSVAWLVHPLKRVFAGLGIDDMFALVTTLQHLTELEMMLPREEKVGLVHIVVQIILMPLLCLSR